MTVLSRSLYSVLQSSRVCWVVASSVQQLNWTTEDGSDAGQVLVDIAVPLVVPMLFEFDQDRVFWGGQQTQIVVESTIRQC